MLKSRSFEFGPSPCGRYFSLGSMAGHASLDAIVTGQGLKDRPDMVLIAIATIPVAIWLYLLVGRGAFWRSAERDHWHPPRPSIWPRVAVVVPARDEAASIGHSIST